MPSSPILGFDEMAVNQANKYVTFNEAVKLLEATAHSVISRTTSAEPGSPSDGDAYILPASPTGTDWGTYAQNDILVYRGSEWFRVAPFEGVTLWVNDEDFTVTYDGSSYVNTAIYGIIGAGLLTAGAIPFVNAAADGLTFDTANLLWDDSNNRLGVNTTPDEALDVDGNFKLTTGWQLIDAGGSAANPALRIGQADKGLFSSGTDELALAVAGGEALKIDGSKNLILTTGNFGIGTTPTQVIDIETSSGINLAIFKTTGDNLNGVRFDSNRTAANSELAIIQSYWNGTGCASLRFLSGADTTNKDEGYATLAVADAGVAAEAQRWKQNKEVIFFDGIYLSNGSDILDTYEEGTWSPVIADASSGGNTATFTNNNAQYKRIGNVVTVRFDFSGINTTGMTGANLLWVRGLPFAADATSTYGGNVRLDDINVSGKYVTVEAVANNPLMVLQETNNGSFATAILVGDLTSGTAAIRGMLTYYV